MRDGCLEIFRVIFFFLLGPEKDQKIHLKNKVLIQALRKDDAQN